MRILLPPSEGKSAPGLELEFALERLSFPQLTAPRLRVATALVSLSKQPKRAATALGLGPTQLGELEANRSLWSGPLSPAISLFSGVVFDALEYPSLTPAQRRRADEQLVIFNGLTGVAAPQDLLPAFRLSGAVTLPRVGNVGTFWKRELARVLSFPADELVVDARSGTYSRFWIPQQGTNFVEVKVIQLVGDGGQQRKVAVSHFNKATKGRLVRDLLTSRAAIKDLAGLTARLESLGCEFELVPARGNRPQVLEVVMRP